MVTRVSVDLLAEVDELVTEGVVDSRSDAVRIGLRRLVDSHRRRRVGDAIVAGYAAQPQLSGEIGWADEATIAMIADEPW